MVLKVGRARPQADFVGGGGRGVTRSVQEDSQSTVYIYIYSYTESSSFISNKKRLSHQDGKPLAGRRTKIQRPGKNGSIDVHSMTFDAVGYLKQYRSGKSSFCASNRSSRMPNHICTDYLFMVDLSWVLFVCEGVMQISCSFHSFFPHPLRFSHGGT